MIKRFISLIMIPLSLMSLVSCGQTVKLSGIEAEKNNEADISELAVSEAEEKKKEDTTKPTEECAPPKLNIDVKMPKDHNLPKDKALDFKTVLQEPELPTGCEITALAQTLNYYGFGIDKVQLCDTFLLTDYDGYYSMDERYLGDPHTTYGFGCSAKTIVKTANKYFEYIKSDWYAIDLTGSDIKELYYQIEQGRPVIVWTTIDQRDTIAEYQFRLGCGEDFYFNPCQHCVTIFGFDYNEKTVHTADPLKGNVKYGMELFEHIYENMGKQAIVLVGNESSKGKDYASKAQKDEWIRKNRPDLVPTEPPTEPPTPEPTTQPETKAPTAAKTSPPKETKTEPEPVPEPQPDPPPEEPQEPEPEPEEPPEEEPQEEPAEEEPQENGEEGENSEDQ